MKEDGDAREPNDDLGIVDALAQLSFAVQGALGRIAAPHDLSPVQTRLLGVLRDRTLGMNELARHLELDKSTVTGLVDRAEKRGLVVRKASSEDRRAIEVSVTAKGRRLIRGAERDFSESIAALVSELDASEQRALSTLATRVVRANARERALGR